MQPVLTPEALNTFLRDAFPGGDDDVRPRVESIAAGRAVLVQPWTERMLRPGGVLSGPTLMGLADTAAYAVILGHIGLQPMAVTSGLSINFLRGCKPGPLRAEAVLMKLGRRLAVVDVRMFTEGPDRIAAQATVTYALPETAP